MLQERFEKERLSRKNSAKVSKEMESFMLPENASISVKRNDSSTHKRERGRNEKIQELQGLMDGNKKAYEYERAVLEEVVKGRLSPVFLEDNLEKVREVTQSYGKGKRPQFDLGLGRLERMRELKQEEEKTMEDNEKGFFLGSLPERKDRRFTKDYEYDDVSQNLRNKR